MKDDIGLTGSNPTSIKSVKMLLDYAIAEARASAPGVRLVAAHGAPRAFERRREEAPRQFSTACGAAKRGASRVMTDQADEGRLVDVLKQPVEECQLRRG
jgi:hypothetical protein